MITSDRSRVWVKKLPQIIKTLNSTPTRITGKEPIKALKSKEVDIDKSKFKRPVGVSEIRLPPFVKVRFLLDPGEDEGGERRRATDPIWSLEVYNLSSGVISEGQPVLYHLYDGPKRKFVREEL